MKTGEDDTNPRPGGKGIHDESALHRWVLGHSRWQCEVCLATTRTDVMPPKRAKERCKGRINGGTEDKTVNRGHEPVTFGNNGDYFIACRKCGGISSRNAGGKMSRNCAPPTSWGIQVLKKVFTKGVHPVTRQPLDLVDVNGVIRSRHDNITRRMAKRLSRGRRSWQGEYHQVR